MTENRYLSDATEKTFNLKKVLKIKTRLRNNVDKIYLPYFTQAIIENLLIPYSIQPVQSEHRDILRLRKLLPFLLTSP